MQRYDDLIKELSELCGILPEYYDIYGKKHEPSVATRTAFLKSMGVAIHTCEDLEREIRERKYFPWTSIIEPVYVIPVNEQPFSVPVYLPLEEGNETALMISWSLKDELGQLSEFKIAEGSVKVHEVRWIEGLRYVRVHLCDTATRDIGYYELRVQCRHPNTSFPEGLNVLEKQSRIIIAPDTCYIPSGLSQKSMCGLSVNLYAIRSLRNWGVGDFTDLKRILQWVSALECDYVGINPLHALPNTTPFGNSPYSPVSRLYKNFIYLDVENIPYVKDSELPEEASASDQIARLRENELVEYEAVASLKERALRHSFTVFWEKDYGKGTDLDQDFQSYVTEEGDSLEYFACYTALASEETTGRKMNWKGWPQVFHETEGQQVCRFRDTHAREIIFYKYVQWLIDRQHREVAAEAERLEMSLGIYHDLAIGSLGEGSDAWAYQRLVAHGATVGAPPDDFSPGGQNWGFPPLIPEKLRESGYDLFIKMIQKNMKYSGVIRIDHALGMFRLFWIPEGMSPEEGAYVRYPSDELLRIIALESVRNKTVIVAEDLGTIGRNVRKTLKRFRMLSYRLFYFERDYPDPSFLTPDRYPRLALCAVSTHDLPTISGYWAGRDLEIKKKLGQYPDEKVFMQRLEERMRDKSLIISALNSRELLSGVSYAGEGDGSDISREIILAVYQYLALTPCLLLLVSLDDILGVLDQQNMPGTVGSYPNWRAKTPVSLEEIAADRGIAELMRAIAKTL